MRLSERQQVAAIIAVAGIVIFALWVFLLTPQNRKRRQMVRDIETMSSQLAASNYLLGEESLRNKRDQEQRRCDEYARQLKEAFSRLSTLPEDSSVTNEFGRIDYKAGLFGVRQRLQRKSKTLGINLPHDLGMGESVKSTADVRKLMLQLRAVEEMTDLALNLKIKMIRDIEPLLPIQHTAGDNKLEFLEEYPVRVSFYGSTGNLYDLFQEILNPRHIFVFRNLRVEKASPSQPDLLEISAILSALVFSEAPATAAATAPLPVSAPRTGPRGY